MNITYTINHAKKRFDVFGNYDLYYKDMKKVSGCRKNTAGGASWNVPLTSENELKNVLANLNSVPIEQIRPVQEELSSQKEEQKTEQQVISPTKTKKNTTQKDTKKPTLKFVEPFVEKKVEHPESSSEDENEDENVEDEDENVEDEEDSHSDEDSDSKKSPPPPPPKKESHRKKLTPYKEKVPFSPSRKHKNLVPSVPAHKDEKSEKKFFSEKFVAETKPKKESFEKKVKKPETYNNSPTSRKQLKHYSPKRVSNSPVSRKNLNKDSKAFRSPEYKIKYSSDRLNYYKNLGKKHTFEVEDSSTDSESESSEEDYPSPTPPQRKGGRR
jgi:hypothetical protein